MATFMILMPLPRSPLSGTIAMGGAVAPSACEAAAAAEVAICCVRRARASSKAGWPPRCRGRSSLFSATMCGRAR